MFINIPLSDGQFWGAPVDTAGDLPATGAIGEVRIAIDTQDAYMWDGASWIPAFGGGGGGSGDVTGPASSVNNQAGSGAAASGSADVKCNAGDTLAIYSVQSATYGAISGGIYQNYLSISKIGN